MGDGDYVANSLGIWARTHGLLFLLLSWWLSPLLSPAVCGCTCYGADYWLRHGPWRRRHISPLVRAVRAVRAGQSRRHCRSGAQRRTQLAQTGTARFMWVPLVPRPTHGAPGGATTSVRAASGARQIVSLGGSGRAID